MKITKSQIRKLGERLKTTNCSKDLCSEEDLQLLQNYRISYKDSLNEVFNVLSEESKMVHNGRILSFRIKKIDTILSKLIRLPKMQLDRMGDIAGCRCILQSESAVYKTRDLLATKLTLLNENDRIKSPDIDGYRALHLYVKPKNCDDSKVIEIQLKTNEQHNWSTLVEIIDVLYNVKIKEGDQSSPELNDFLSKYACKGTLNVESKLRLSLIEKKYDIYKKMSNTFFANLLKLRGKWFEMENIRLSDSFLILKVNKINKETSMSIFDSFEKAEDEYFNRFIDSEDDALVCHLDIRNFKQLSIAYSNYLLTNHNFQDDWIDLVCKVIEELIDLGKIKKANELFNNYKEIIDSEQHYFNEEIQQIDAKFNASSNDVNQYLKLNEWFSEREERIFTRNTEFLEIERKLNELQNEGVQSEPKLNYSLMSRLFKKIGF